jgi:PAS domain S-box-containing protein
MKIHKKLMFLVGLGMLLILAITILSLRYLTDTLARSSHEMAEISSQSRQIWNVERRIDELVEAVQNFSRTGDRTFMRLYGNAHRSAKESLERLSAGDFGANQSIALATISKDLELLQKTAEGIFFSSSRGERGAVAAELTQLLDLQKAIKQQITKYQETGAGEMKAALGRLPSTTGTIYLAFLAMLVTSLGCLALFAVYIHRTVSIPLSDLSEGTEEISRGNLDYRLQVQDGDDFSRLGQRFNEMAQRLRASYADLERKLYDRTHELASINAVALALTQAGTLEDLLDKSLQRIIDSLAGMQPRGGVFLCEPGGEVLRLTVQKGLPADFVERESVIRMGECLCGKVAQNGKLMFEEHACEDARHTRSRGEPHSHIIIPIKSRGNVLGVIFLYPEKEFKLKPSDIQMLEAIGAQVGMAVENFRFYAEVKESGEKYWDLFENASDILFTMDSTGRLTAANRAAESFSGYSKAELYGKSILDFLDGEAAETAGRWLQSGGSGQPWTEFEVLKRDGGRAFIDVSARRLVRNRQSAGYQVSARDITEQKRMREMLLEAERLCAIGQIVVTVRHEINNPLTTVIGNVELLMERYEKTDKELARRLATILNNALRIAEIVKQLQAIKKDKVVEYLKGVTMTDLKQK